MSKNKTRRDTAAIARSVVEQAIGQPLTSRPEDDVAEDQPEADAGDTRNQAAVTLSKLGASKGGKARAKNLSKKRRSEIAKKAAKARCNNRRKV